MQQQQNPQPAIVTQMHRSIQPPTQILPSSTTNFSSVQQGQISYEVKQVGVERDYELRAVKETSYVQVPVYEAQYMEVNRPSEPRILPFEASLKGERSRTG